MCSACCRTTLDCDGQLGLRCVDGGGRTEKKRIEREVGGSRGKVEREIKGDVEINSTFDSSVSSRVESGKEEPSAYLVFSARTEWV